MSNIKSYRDLEAWQLGMELAEKVHRLTRRYPKEELFGLTSQTRRAASSIPANIAEGHSRNTRKEFKQFVLISRADRLPNWRPTSSSPNAWITCLVTR